MRTQITYYAHTDAGRVRDHNEDALGSDPDIGLYVLADGMGGYNAGEVASGIAVKTIINQVRESYERYSVEGHDPTTNLSRPAIVLRDAVVRANKIIHQTSKSQAHCEGMGTTVVAMLFHNNRVCVAHVGDSRAYRERGGELVQLTTDHSLLQELVDRGLYSREEAARATSKNFVTRALGVDPTVDVEVHEHPAHPADRYLLCSDGLSDMVDDAEVHSLLEYSGATLEQIGRTLVLRANENGGRDNISVMITEVVEPFPAKRGAWDRILGWFR
jgi:PPM family protein phosphatase